MEKDRVVHVCSRLGTVLVSAWKDSKEILQAKMDKTGVSLRRLPEVKGLLLFLSFSLPKTVEWKDFHCTVEASWELQVQCTISHWIV